MGADWGAVETETVQPEALRDPDLAIIVHRWDSLPEAVRAGIVAMVEAVTEKTAE